ncbi:MAG: hypothetical protein JXB26_16230 [Candidatus Aminicenantes bacterium]|nr:hypothetical protein [Candidatus Aminicenantes bacterium]
MADKKSKIWASITAFITGLGILFVYLFNKTVPLTEVYLDGDRRFHAVATSILFLLAFLFFRAGGKKTRKKGARVLFYMLAVVFLLAFPVFAFYAEASTYRGFEYALETLGIGFLPAAFFLFGALILSGMRVFSMILFLFFSVFCLIHLVSFFRMIGRIGKAFSSVNTGHALTAGIITLLLGVFAYFNFQNARK